MLIRVKYVPIGPEEPARRVPLPTYNARHYDDEHGVVLADVPLDVFGPDVQAAWDKEPIPSPIALTAVAAQPSWLGTWHKYLDTRYPSLAGTFRPEFV